LTPSNALVVEAFCFLYSDVLPKAITIDLWPNIFATLIITNEACW